MIELGNITVFSCDTIYFSHCYSQYSDKKYRDILRIRVCVNMCLVGDI